MKKITLLLLTLSFSICSLAQITIEGTVSHDSIPLELTSVIIKNTKKGVATDEKGQFKIEAKKGDTLSVSYLGFETKEITVKDNKHLNLKLVEDSELDQVIIIAYSNHRRICCGSFCKVIHIEERNYLKQPKLYPNPSSNGIFQLKLVEDYDEVKISVANISGQTIHNSIHQKFRSKLNIDLSEFATGIYIINIIADGEHLEVIKAIRS